MINLESAQRAAIQSSIHRGLLLPLGPQETKIERQLAAYAEIVADPNSASEALLLAEAIDAEVMLARKCDITVDPSELMEVHPKRMVRASLIYAGVSPIRSKEGEAWVVGEGGRDVLKLPATLLEDYCGH